METTEPSGKGWFGRHKILTGLGMGGAFILIAAIGAAVPPVEDDPASVAVGTEEPAATPTPTATSEPDPVTDAFLAAGLDAPTERELELARDQCASIRADEVDTLRALAQASDADRTTVVTKLEILCPKVADKLSNALRDTDADGKLNFEDDYDNDPNRWTDRDRDGDGVNNKNDVAPANPGVSSWASGVVTRVIDGDTVDVGGIGTIRVIGIDTPEEGECGYTKASAVTSSLVLGKTVTLVPGAQDDVDRYGRLLRYVDVGTMDAGLQVIKRGFAIARYDSRDGYGAHPREARYIEADAASPSRNDEFCPAPPPASPAPSGVGAQPWNQPGPDLDCADIGHRVLITGPDYHDLDEDGDGIGCDSYG